MCGRGAQTQRAVRAAANSLHGGAQHEQNQDSNQQEESFHDNYNMSPGMQAEIFFCNKENKVISKHATWGLVPHGTKDVNISMHFSSNMFNARSDTLFERRTFSRLLSKSQTCLVALDGFFEWKAGATKLEPKKQPYYVYDERKPFLCMAGLWDSDNNLDTFTIITTDAAPSLTWLHHRMPLIISIEKGLEWLQNPTNKLLKQMEQESWTTLTLKSHKVTPEMSRLGFRGEKAIQPFVASTPSVKDFFGSKRPSDSPKKTTITSSLVEKGQKVTAGNDSTKKRQTNTTTSPVEKKQKVERTSANEKQKATPRKGAITSFFTKK